MSDRKSGRIVNRGFHDLLRECRDAQGDRYTVEKLAQAVGYSRPHLNKVLLNYEPTRWQLFGKSCGGRTRQRVARFFHEQFPQQAAALLAALGWTANGARIVPHGESHGEPTA